MRNSESLKIAGELLWPQLMSNGEYSRPRCRDQTSLPLMSSATIWPVPNHAYTRRPSVTGLDEARLCLSWTSASCPSAGSSYSHSLRPSARFSAVTRKTTFPDPADGAAAERAFSGVCRVATLHERRMISRPPRAAPDLRRDEHLIAPHDRRRYAEAADGRFPRDVLRVAPPLGQGGFARHTSGRRPSPMGPVLGVCRGERHHDGEGEQEESHGVLGDIIVRDAQSVKQDSCFTQASSSSRRSSGKLAVCNEQYSSTCESFTASPRLSSPFRSSLAPFAQAPEADRYWPQWRGPLANGISRTANPPIEWSEKSNVRWKVEIPGRGSASPVIWGDRVFVLTAIPGRHQRRRFARAARRRQSEGRPSLRRDGARSPRRPRRLAAHRARGSAARSVAPGQRHVGVCVGDDRRPACDRVVRVARHLRVRHERQAGLAERSRRQVDAQRVRRGQHAGALSQSSRRRVGSHEGLVHHGARQEHRQRAVARQPRRDRHVGHAVRRRARRAARR